MYTFYFAGFAQLAQTSSNTSTVLTDFDKNCLEEKLSMSVGLDHYIYSNYNFRKSFYSIDAETSFYLETLVNILNSRDITLVKVIPLLKSITENEFLSDNHPNHAMFSVDENLEYYYQHLEKLNAFGIIAVNVYKTYAENHEDENFFIDYDSHWSLLGARLAALTIAEAIRSTPTYETLDKSTYKTIVQGEYEFFGASKAISKRCSVDIGPYISQNLFTNKELDTAAMLFAEETYPVVVVGTSFSLKPFNFVGFLSQALSLDVLNWSKPSAKLEGSILPYFVSDEFRHSPPKFLIWESANFSFENPVKQLRQIVPAAIGGCEAKDRIYEASFDIQTTPGAERYTLFENLENILANQHYLELSYTGHTLTSKVDLIRINSKFGTGEEDIKLLDHKFFDDKQKIFYLFSHLDHELTSISVSLPQNIDISLEAKLCTLTY